jgi:type I restriction enzyme R subunit
MAQLAPSPNFAFLAYHDPRLVEVATRAENAVAEDPVGSLVHTRPFGELLAKHVAARMAASEPDRTEQAERLRTLSRAGLPQNVLDLFHSVRVAGNDAAHRGEGDQQTAFTELRIASQLAIWFQRTFGNNRKFAPGPYIPPKQLRADTEELKQELATLRAAAKEHAGAAEAARLAADEQAKRALGAEEAARRAAEEREFWEALARETEAEKLKNAEELRAAQIALEELRARLEAELRSVQREAATQPAQQVAELVSQAAAAANASPWLNPRRAVFSAGSCASRDLGSVLSAVCERAEPRVHENSLRWVA